MSRFAKLGLVLLANLAFALVTFAQSGSISGTVVDAQGAAIAGAQVQALDQARGIVVREATSGADGIFILQPLLPGTYTVKVNAKGMKELVRTDLVLDQNQVLGIGRLEMAVGAATETVTVEATTPLVETATSDRSSGVITAEQVLETQVNGRDFQSLMKTLPGVVSNNGSDFQLQFNNTDQMHVNGLRGSDNNVFLDGAINTDVGANDGQYTQLSLDAVGEFKVMTGNYNAEYGRNPGVMISVNTKSGGQQYHGTLYEFNREDGFGAIPYGQTTTAFLRFNQWGANLGGPIIIPKVSPRNNKKMFFFFNYEGLHGLRPGNTQFNSQVVPGLGRGYFVPNPNTFQGDFSSQYTGGNMCVNTGTTGGHTIAQTPDCPTGQGDNGFLNGQIFQPGSILFNSSGQIVSGAPYANNQIPTTPTPCSYNASVQCGFDAQAPAWIKYWQGTAYALGTPVPYNGTATTAQKYFVPYNETYTLFKRQLVARYDWNINAKTDFFFRWVDDAQTENYHNLFDYADYPILPEYRKKPGSSWSWNLVNTISPTITNEFIFSYNHLTQVVDIVPGTSQSLYNFQDLGFTFGQLYPASNIDDRAPVNNACCNGYLTGGSFHPGWASEARTFDWTDNVTWVHGAHALKFGIFFDYNQAGQQPVWNDAVFLQFNTGSSNPMDSGNYLANTLLGNYTQAQQTNGVFFGQFRFHQFEMFAQDSWKVNRRLTLDYGLRWAYLGPTYTVKPFFQNYFEPQLYNPADKVTLNTTPGNYFGDICSAALAALPGGASCQGITNYGNPYNGLVEENHGIPPGGVNHRWNNFMPRFGFAYDVFGDGKTAIRGGAGIFYERIRQNNNSFDALGNPPLSYTATVFNGQLDNLGPQDITGVLAPFSSVNAFDIKGQIPTIYGYSLGVQRELPWKLGLDVSYVGNQGRHLLYWYNLNSLPIGCNPLSDGSTSCGPAAPNTFYLPYTGYNTINWTSFGANSSYNSLQVNLIRRFGKSLTLTTNFVWSKTMDLEDNDNGNINATNGGGAALTDPYHPFRDWARAGYDRARTFNLNSTYILPNLVKEGPLKYVANGWEWGTVWKWWSGTPLDVLMQNGPGGSYTGNSGNFIGVVRPDLVPGVNPYLGRNTSTWLNPAAFAAPAIGTVGDIGRNAFTGPGINNWDMSLFKNFAIREHMTLQLRWEVYNVFNHPQPNNANYSFAFSSSGSTATIEPTNGLTPGVTNGFRDPRSMQIAAKFYF